MNIYAVSQRPVDDTSSVLEWKSVFADRDRAVGAIISYVDECVVRSDRDPAPIVANVDGDTVEIEGVPIIFTIAARTVIV